MALPPVSTKVKRALVLSGGSIRGAFQAGAVPVVFDRGWVPDGIYGVSVGSLNGGFLTDRAGRMKLSGQEIDWPAVGQQLIDFWRDKVTSPAAVGEKRKFLKVAWHMLIKEFNGLMSTDALKKLVDKELSEDNMLAAGIRFAAGYVDMNSGQFIDSYPGDGHTVDGIIASTAIPVIMPYSLMRGHVATDGGVRNVSPFAQAINDGAEEIVAIICQPESLVGCCFTRGNLIEFAERLMAIIVNETVNNDIKIAENVNKSVRAGLHKTVDTPLSGKREIKLTVIRPDEELEISLDSFTSADIQRVMKLGRDVAERVLNSQGGGAVS